MRWEKERDKKGAKRDKKGEREVGNTNGKSKNIRNYMRKKRRKKTIDWKKPRKVKRENEVWEIVNNEENKEKS